MPIIDVEIVTRDSESLPSELTQNLANTIGRLLETPVGQTWVRVRRIPSSAYAENADYIRFGSEEHAIRPIFVRVLHRKLPSVDTRRSQARSIADVVARLCKHPPENVHVLFEPEAAGRMAFGGILIETGPDHEARHC